MDYENGECVISRASEAEWESSMELCWKTFLKFEAPVYEAEGSDNFLKFISDEQLYKMFCQGDYILWVAKVSGRIVGVGSLRARSHISLLFVDEEYQNRGIGRNIVKTMQEYVELCTGSVVMSVNSSPYAEEFYHKIGFVNSGDKTRVDGIIYTPMILPSRV